MTCKSLRCGENVVTCPYVGNFFYLGRIAQGHVLLIIKTKGNTKRHLFDDLASSKINISSNKLEFHSPLAIKSWKAQESRRRNKLECGLTSIIIDVNRLSITNFPSTSFLWPQKMFRDDVPTLDAKKWEYYFDIEIRKRKEFLLSLLLLLNTISIMWPFQLGYTGYTLETISTSEVMNIAMLILLSNCKSKCNVCHRTVLKSNCVTILDRSKVGTTSLYVGRDAPKSFPI